MESENIVKELFDKKISIKGKMYFVYYETEYEKNIKNEILMVFKSFNLKPIVYKVSVYKNPSLNPKPSEVSKLNLLLNPCNSDNHPWLEKNKFFEFEFIRDLEKVKLFRYNLENKGYLYIYEQGIEYTEDELDKKSKIIIFKNGRLFKGIYTKIEVSDKNIILIPGKIKTNYIKGE